MKRSRSRLILIGALFAGSLAACSDGGNGAGNNSGGSGGGAPQGAGGFGGNAFNQCGVAAPLPADTGQCTGVNAPTIADFDDHVAGMAASSYAYYINGKPPATGAVLGGVLHIGDGSDTNGGASIIATEMVTGAGDTGYALQISNTNATIWGGLLMFYFPFSGTTATCLNAGTYRGVAFSIKGSSPSGRFGVSLGMVDTTPTADNGLCSNGIDCKSPTVEMRLPVDAATWTQVSVPWSAFTPGVGNALSCVPVTGQNILRLVIQPFMSYPPPNYMLAPGPYTMTVDDVRFF